MQVMARRLKDINPEIKVIAKQQFLDPQAARDLAKVPCDFIVDCIDSITPKVGFFYVLLQLFSLHCQNAPPTAGYGLSTPKSRL
jgi:tRNA A37 threonylcarbamoyladenosine dehydratase